MIDPRKRNRVWNSQKPYDQLAFLPPKLIMRNRASVIDLESKSVLKACSQAREMVGRVREACKRLPNPSLLVDAMIRQEVKASSAIENIVTTNDRLYNTQIELEERTPSEQQTTQEVRRNRQALWHGFEMLKHRPITVKMAIEICRILREVDVDLRQVPGTSLQNPHTQQVHYMPPNPDKLPQLLSNWEEFINGKGLISVDAAENSAENPQDQLDPLVKMAVQHYQFEAIHPFTDGNGRTGRALNILFLIQTGLIDLPILNLSRSIQNRRDEYYEKLLGVTSHQDWEAWLLYFIETVDDGARWSLQLIDKLSKLMREVEKQLMASDLHLRAAKLSEIIFQYPYSQIETLVEAEIAERQTASVYLKWLVEMGILKERKVGRSKVFINHQMMAALED